jgi:Na+-transporting NADH:ubiquinone oxidoreductase subunit A
MLPIRIKRGYNINLDGAPHGETMTLARPSQVAVLPNKIRFIRPKLRISQGDHVDIGDVLFHDKRQPNLVFLSPGGGIVTGIHFGPRRVIESVVIDLDDTETHRSFGRVDDATLQHMERTDLINMLMKGGMWSLIRSLPFRDIASPNEEPPCLIISLGGQAPFSPNPDIYLGGQTDLFAFGIQVLRKLANDRLIVAASKEVVPSFGNLKDMLTHTFEGDYPAHDAGVLSYHTKTSQAENLAWYINGQDVLLLASLLRTGRYPTERIVVVAGPMATERRHIKTRIGIPLSMLVSEEKNGDATRYVVGGVLTGYKSDRKSFMGFYETALNLLPEGNTREFLSLFRPGYEKPSYSRTFFSVFNRKPLLNDCNVHGGPRACIGCNHCPVVCPVDILPQLTYKSILADDIEKALAHGLLDCVECGLCSYVCPSKIGLTETLIDAKASYYKEQTQ